MTRKVFVVCNALDDATRQARRISTDSPAASRKVFLLARTLRRAGVRVVVLSYGRGRQDGSGGYFAPVVRRVGGIPTVYMPFVQRPLASELLSMLAPLALMRRIRRTAGTATVLFYNRPVIHVPGLLLARLLGLRTVVDLEDGEVGYARWSVAGVVSRLCRWTFDKACSGGALLACSALADLTDLEPTMCYYGTIEVSGRTADWQAPCITVLFGGTIGASTGGRLLLDAIGQMRSSGSEWCRRLCVVVTGQGDCAEQFRALAAEPGFPHVEFCGRTTDAEYAAILQRSHLGLALKPSAGPLAHSTFPSKVVELASAGLLVVTTPISDVRLVLGPGAVYLEEERPAALVAILRSVVEQRSWAAAVAAAGQGAVAQRCAPAVTGPLLARFLTEGVA